jgi:hypothetical protein
MLLAELAIDLHEFQGDDVQAFGFEPLKDLADQSALDAVGLANDQGALHVVIILAAKRADVWSPKPIDP